MVGAECCVPGAGPPQRGWKQVFALSTAFVTCPCHLPILALLLAGTALGAFLAQNLAFFGVGMMVYFVAALGYGMKGAKVVATQLT